MKRETLEQVAEILGNGYKCFVHLETEEVHSSDSLPLDKQKSDEYKSYIPLEGPLTFKMMQDFTAQVEDFAHQSELMEALGFEQPFFNFKNKVYRLHLADDWLAYRKAKIVEVIG